MFGRQRVNEADIMLFEEKVNNRSYDEAVIIGSNLLNKNPGDKALFGMLFKLLCDLAIDTDDILIEEGYYGLANDACSSFTLAMDVDESNIELVTKCRKRLKEVQEDRIRKQIDIENREKERKIKANRDIVEGLREIISKINDCDSREDIEALAKEVVKLDNSRNPDYMTPVQDAYDSVMKELAVELDRKSQYLERIKNLKINEDAVDTYKSVLEAFKKKENDYKKDMRRFYETFDMMFQYDENVLFPETITYYSQVYNYIFMAVDEIQKYYITRHIIRLKGGSLKNEYPQQL